MAKIWKEAFGHKTSKSGQHLSGPSDRMTRIGTKLPYAVPAEVWFVKVCGFTFSFHNLDQLNACLSYYSSKTHPSSIISSDVLAAGLGEDWRELRGWEIERWFERLPMFLLESAKSVKVIKALERAKQEWERETPDVGVRRTP